MSVVSIDTDTLALGIAVGVSETSLGTETSVRVEGVARNTDTGPICTRSHVGGAGGALSVVEAVGQGTDTLAVGVDVVGGAAGGLLTALVEDVVVGVARHARTLVVYDYGIRTT